MTLPVTKNLRRIFFSESVESIKTSYPARPAAPVSLSTSSQALVDLVWRQNFAALWSAPFTFFSPFRFVWLNPHTLLIVPKMCSFIYSVVSFIFICLHEFRFAPVLDAFYKVKCFHDNACYSPPLHQQIRCDQALFLLVLCPYLDVLPDILCKQVCDTFWNYKNRAL